MASAPPILGYIRFADIQVPSDELKVFALHEGMQSTLAAGDVCVGGRGEPPQVRPFRAT